MSYSDHIRALPAGPLGWTDVLRPSFRTSCQDSLEIYFATFDWINRSARIVLFGITPGLTQMTLAFEAARDALIAGASEDEVWRRAKERASFGGSMRRDLDKMLAEIGLPNLFVERKDTVHYTSVLRYPVFVNGKNYTGRNPSILKTPLLLKCVNEVFVPEIRLFDRPLIVPLGQAVSEVCSMLVEKGVLHAKQVLTGFPHPSGANPNRWQVFEGMKLELAKKVQEWTAGLFTHG